METTEIKEAIEITDETIESSQNEVEPTPFEQHCPRHGARIRQYYGCPKCVMEEVRRHEKRMDDLLMDDLLMMDEPIPVDPVQQAAPMAEMI